jgi:hypothetical protein
MTRRQVQGAALIAIALACGERDASPPADTSMMQAGPAADSMTVSEAALVRWDTVTLPAFADYAVRERFRGRPAPVRLATDPQARFFRTKLREGARAGPNFADHLTVVTWGCGTGCQVNAIVDARTGEIHPQWLQTNAGVAVRRGSALLIADPVDTLERPPGPCSSCGIPAAYLWRGNHLEPVGDGPHPHILEPTVRLERFGH